MNLILFSVTTFAVLDYFYRFMRFVSTDLAKIAKFLCFYSKSGLFFIDCDDFTTKLLPPISVFYLLSSDKARKLLPSATLCHP